MQQGTAPRPLTPRTKGPELRIRHGLADQLARLSHFATLDLPEVRELDEIACWLIGPACHPAVVWKEIRPVCEHLFRLNSADWDEEDLDGARECDPPLPADLEIADRHTRTVERLRGDIEDVVGFARLRWAEIKRAEGVLR